MADVFISHVEEDAQLAELLAHALEAAGFTTWYYERDSVGGVSYLLQSMNAIEQSQAVLLLISRDSLSSNQVTTEVIHAHESNKAFVPILVDITHVEFQTRQPEWRAAIGAATTLPIQGRDLALVIPRIIAGLRALGVGSKPMISTGEVAAEQAPEVEHHIDSPKTSKDVFISYSSKDNEIATVVCRIFEENGISFWIDFKDIPAGQKWPAEIVEAIQECKVFLLILSIHANESPQVDREITKAGERKPPPLFYCLKLDYSNPSNLLSYFISYVQWTHAQEPPIDKHVSFLVESIKESLGKDPPPPSPPSQKSVFVGREQEIRKLQQHLTKTKGNHFQFILISGEEGMGKTALVENFLLKQIGSNAKNKVARGKCNKDTIPLSPFVDVLLDLYQIGQASTDPQQKKDQYETLALLLKDIAPIWSNLLLSIYTKQIKNMETSQEYLFFEFQKVITNIANNCILEIFLDDYQWMDNLSASLLLYLCKNLSDNSIYIFLTFRPSSLEERRDLLEIKHEIVLKGGIELPELIEGISVKDYVNNRFSPNDFPSAFVDTIQQKTEGLPIFVQYLFDWLIENDSIVLEKNAIGKKCWHTVDPSSSLERIPETIYQLISNRLNIMEENLREILYCGSIEGEDFTAQIIARVQKLDELKLGFNLEDLEKHYRFIHSGEERSLGLQTYLSLYHFAHRIVRDCIYDRLSTHLKRLLHLRVGESLEELYRDQLSLVAPQLATHFQIAHLPEKACHYYVLASQTAYNRFAWRDALEFAKKGFQLANTLTTDSSRKWKTEALLAWAASTVTSDEHKAVFPILDEEVIAASADENSRSYLLKLQLALIRILYFQNDNKVLSEGKKCLELAKTTGSLEEIYNVLDWLADILSDNLSRYQEAIKANQEKLDIAKQIGEAWREADALYSLSWCYVNLGKYAKVIEYAEKSIDLINQLADVGLYAQATSFRCLGLGYFGQGNYSASVDMQKKALSFFLQFSDKRLMAWILRELGRSYHVWQHFQEAEDLYLQCLNLAGEVGGEEELYWSRLDLFDLALDQNDLSKAAVSLQLAEPLLDKNNFEDYFDYCIALAKLRIRQGLFKDAMESLNEAEKRLVDTDSDLFSIQLYVMRGLLFYEERDHQNAIKSLVQGLELSESLSAEVWMAVINEHLGSTYLSFGENDLAKRYLSKALELRQKMGHDWLFADILRKLEFSKNSPG